MIISTDRLVVTIEGKRTEPLSSSTHWYEPRNQLVRNMEAARDLADARAWGCLLLSAHPVPEATPEALVESLPAAAPHLSDQTRASARPQEPATRSTS